MRHRPTSAGSGSTRSWPTSTPPAKPSPDCCDGATPARAPATDHIQVLDDALFQLPVNPTDTEVIMRADTAGCSHAFLDACRDRDVRFIVGHRLTAETAQLLIDLPQDAWQTAVSADGTEERDWAQVGRSPTTSTSLAGPKAPE
jgi:hypothetical protein